MGKVLIIEDDVDMAKILARMAMGIGHDSDCAASIQTGLTKALSGSYDVILLDVNLPDGDGLKILPDLLGIASPPEVIIMTGFGDPDGAETAIENGAWDYLEKPISQSRLALSLNRAFQYRENRNSRPVSSFPLKLDGVVGKSSQMKACLELVAQAASSEANVLICGETGTGKELIARAIHENSPRALKNLIVVDCAALPETLVESLLFGHERGSYTGADRSMEGLIKQADGGSLFLDEVGELPLSIQKTFLRVLQERRFRPVGGKLEMKSDFRLICATNRNLDQMVEQGRFRADLLFRIRSISIELPPLRTRREDIKELVFHYIDKLCKKYEVQAKGYSPDFMETLLGYEWPGNIRELVNTLDRTLSLARHEPILFSKHLPVSIRVKAARSAVSLTNGSYESSSDEQAAQDNVQTTGRMQSFRVYRQEALRRAERDYLQELVKLAKGSLKEAGRISGLGRTQLYILLKRHGISRLGW